MLPDMQYSFVARNGETFAFFRSSAPPIDTNDMHAANTQLRSVMKVDVRNAQYSHEYNCHGLTFVARLGRFGWFNPDDVKRFLNAHNYRLIAEATNFQIDDIVATEKIMQGDVIVYLDGSKVEHTGIVWSVRKKGGKLMLRVLSKWGDMSEYFHSYSVVPPNYGKTIQIWTDRHVV